MSRGRYGGGDGQEEVFGIFGHVALPRFGPAGFSFAFLVNRSKSHWRVSGFDRGVRRSKCLNRATAIRMQLPQPIGAEGAKAFTMTGWRYHSQ